MKFDIENLNHLAERLDYKPDSQQHKDNLAEYCNQDRMMAFAKAYLALEQRAETAEAEFQRLNATAQPVRDGCKVPEGWKLVPIDPTEEMIIAVSKGLAERIKASRYRAMLAAAPGGQDD